VSKKGGKQHSVAPEKKNRARKVWHGKFGGDFRGEIRPKYILKLL